MIADTLKADGVVVVSYYNAFPKCIAQSRFAVCVGNHFIDGGKQLKVRVEYRNPFNSEVVHHICGNSAVHLFAVDYKVEGIEVNSFETVLILLDALANGFALQYNSRCAVLLKYLQENIANVVLAGDLMINVFVVEALLVDVGLADVP